MARKIRRLLLPLLFSSGRPAFTSGVLAFCLAAVSIVSPGPVFAGTTVDGFIVAIQFVNACVIVSATNINFGTTGVIGNTGIDAAGTITAQCTTLAPYNIGLNAGIGTGANVASRLLTSATTTTISYSLFSDAAHLQLWGNTIGTDTVASVGTGIPQAFTVFGHIPSQVTPTAGIYNDTITVTVTF
jgi:spore coat protein U-like protein